MPSVMDTHQTQYKNLMDYFLDIAKVKKTSKYLDLEPSVKKVKADLKKDSVLYAYLQKENLERVWEQPLIYPFGANLSQMEAVEKAFTSQISVIQGPPGTGKTQTILNMLANIIVHGKKAAVVSNNNSAVENVAEKMDKYGFGFLVAQLGSRDKQNRFFNNIPQPPSQLNEWYMENSEKDALENNIQSQIEEMKMLYELKNKEALLKQQIQELKTERYYNNLQTSTMAKSMPKLLPMYHLNQTKLLKYMADQFLEEREKLSLANKVKHLFYYGMYEVKKLNDIENRHKVCASMQELFYEKELEQLQKALKQVRIALEEKRYQEKQDHLSAQSTKVFKHYICDLYSKGIPQLLDQKRFREPIYFEKFTKRFPVILSTAFSIDKSIREGQLLDYIIIDEASQLELVPGILSLAYAKNVVIVGDLKQLPHMPNKNVPKNAVEPCYDYITHNLLSSVIEVYPESLPMTLLREHYRCDPMIIQFCNQKYYDGELIALSESKGDDPLILLQTAQGNHMRGQRSKYNIRELDSLDEEIIREKIFSNNEDVGFLSAYRKQIHAAEEKWTDGEMAALDTVHKFQGREHDGIIFSTVLDEKASDFLKAFVDNPSLLNVAVSRAKRRLVIVSGVEPFMKYNKEISDLIRYIRYYDTEATFEYKSNVTSVFDLLYRKFSPLLLERKSKLKRKDSTYMSEQIMASLLRDILQEESYKKLSFHRNYLLKDFMKDLSIFNKGEQGYIKRGAHCDFLIFYKIGKEPIAGIEVDGTSFHDESQKKQMEKDRMKDEIFCKAGIPLLRLRTNGSGEERKIKDLLDSVLVT
ncbi:AAA domain-containing protein [Shouchella clausii]